MAGVTCLRRRAARAAQPFAVLGAAAVANAGSTALYGDLGVPVASPVSGLGALTDDGLVHQGDAAEASALNAATSAYTALATLPATTALPGLDLGDVGVLDPGVYLFTSSAKLTGTLTLDFARDPGGAFVFVIGSALTTASDADVVVEGGDAQSAIYWDVGSSATLGTGTTFAGNILAQQSITLNTAASLMCGRAIALKRGGRP